MSFHATYDSYNHRYTYNTPLGQYDNVQPHFPYPFNYPPSRHFAGDARFLPRQVVFEL